jgi:repressor LexA
MNNLTQRQLEILEFIQDFFRKERVAPTCREIAGHFGFKSPKAVTDHLCALEKKGYIRRYRGRSRGIEVLAIAGPTCPETISVPIMGDIPAGTPEHKTEYRQGSLAVDSTIIEGISNHRLFALQVKGDSMEGRGIHEGDWVIVDADAAPRKNDVVVALIDGENTLKTLAQKKDNYYLKAENPSCPDWTPYEELQIQGVAKAIIRRLA